MKLKQHTRLSIVVIVIAAVLLEVTTAVQYFTAREGITQQLTEKAQRDLTLSPRIAKVKREVEQAVDKAVPEIKRQLMEVDIDTLAMLLRRLSASQHQVVGVSLGFVPGFIPPHIEQRVDASDRPDGHLGIYIYEEEQEIDSAQRLQAIKDTTIEDSKLMQLHQSFMHFDYTVRPWFASVVSGHHVTQSGMKGYWSEPYEGNINYVLMCSYSRCLHDSTGQAVAVLAADVPLRELSAMATQLIENQHRSLIGIIALQVLGLLALGFIIHRSVKNIRRLQAERIEKERFLSELSVARDIQQSMIPKTFPGYPDRDDVELYASLTPARQVGGDFYDFIFSGSRICFCIGDVTGKGIPAALLMTVTRSFFRTEATRVLNHESLASLYPTPPTPNTPTPNTHHPTPNPAASIVQGMNQILYEEQSSGYFATLFVGVLDLRTGQLDYCNAGHEAPIVINTSNNNMKEETLPVCPNLPVGALDDWAFEGQQTQLQPDDMLLLYTDGLTEAKNEEGQFLTRQRVHEIARQAAGHSPREVVELMETAVKQHAGHAEQSDDITLLCLKWKKKELELKADIEELSRMKDFVVDAAGQAGLSTKDTKRLRLAVEEAVTNVIMYAYDGCQSRPLSIRTNTTDDALLVTVTDEGRPFDPTKAPMADTTLPPDKRPEGGLGILFIHQMSDGLDYRREDGRNILTIRKNLNAKYAS